MQRIIPFSSVLLPVIYHRPLGFMLFFVFFRERQIKAVNLFCSVPEALQKPLTQTRKLTVLVSVSPLLSVKWVKFADFRYIKKSESASICLYYYSILLFLYHKLLFWFHGAKLRIKSDSTKKCSFIFMCLYLVRIFFRIFAPQNLHNSP